MLAELGPNTPASSLQSINGISIMKQKSKALIMKQIFIKLCVLNLYYLHGVSLTQTRTSVKELNFFFLQLPIKNNGSCVSNSGGG